ncbi:MAG: hypothetical protein BWY57_01231 [Betaproteobacteria bacterium ADurb.Bin341]|nr:MAG: hypothetical protein BWY57_01231 [Betaproteobacteria bacterium ADurb.Bin341]
MRKCLLRRLLLTEFAQPGFELEAVVQIAQRFRIWGFRDECRRRGQIRHIAFHRQQLAAERQKIEMGAQIVADHAADFAGVRDHFIERAVLAQPLHRCFGAALGHARYVIDRITHQRQIIDHTLRRHAELGRHPGHIEHLVAHAVVPAHLVVDELGQILIAGGNHRFQPGSGGLCRQGADHIVGLNPFDHNERPAGGTDGGMQRLDLRRQIFRHVRAIGLVVWIPVFTEGFSARIEHHRPQLRLVLGFQPA